MNSEAARENLLTLQNLLGQNEQISQRIIGSSILISGDENYPSLTEYLKSILQKTFENIKTTADAKSVYACEIVLNANGAITPGPHIFLGQQSANDITISSSPPLLELSRELHPFLYFLTSCYVGAFIMKSISENLPVSIPDSIRLDTARIVETQDVFSSEVNLGEAYLAGAGAIGNSFLYALSTFKVRGELKIVDPDFVSGGNLNRCLFFNEDDVLKKKVQVLTEKAQPLFPNLKLTPIPYEFSKIPNKPTDAWLSKLIVGVDSRRARRNLQREIPKEVFDASTTGITEVVVHHHKRPLVGACMGCVYVRQVQEEAHANHIAEVLGVTLDQVKLQFVTQEAASSISQKHNINTSDLIGLSFDTLFKQLCGEGKLKSTEGKQVLAPLAFVSALAGAFLALNVVQNHLGVGSYNYWRLSPWAEPNFRLRQNLLKNVDCEFCNDKTYLQVATSLWPSAN